jgi:hypothetical protein
MTFTLSISPTDPSAHRLGWNMEDKFWVKEQTFVDVNGRGGVACHIRPEVSTVVAQNKTDVVFFWRDSNSTKRGSATHPINVWQRGKHRLQALPYQDL